METTRPEALATPDGQRVVDGRYRLEERIGVGGMAVVWRAHDTRLHRPVALKLLAEAGAADPRRFAVEARTLARLEHPNLVRLLDAGQDPRQAYLVMDLVEGPTLAELLRGSSLSATRVAHLGRDVASALAYVHRHGVVHRDVKPANILLGPGERVRLTDFGIARLMDSTRFTATSSSLGTPAYLAPEQVRGDQVGPPADVYALGLVLAEALTGRRPFEGPAHEVALARLARDPEFPDTLPAGWGELLRAMTARDPADRPGADRLVGALDRLAAAPGPAGKPGGLAVGSAGVAAAGVAAAGVAAAGVAAGPTAAGPAAAGPAAGPAGTRVGDTRLLPTTGIPTHPRRRRAGVLAGVLLAAVLAGVLLAGLGHGSPPASTDPGHPKAATQTATHTATPAAPTPAAAAGNFVAVLTSADTHGSLTQQGAQDLLGTLQPLLSGLGQASAGQVDQQVAQLAQTLGSDIQNGQVTTTAAADALEAALRSLATALGVTTVPAYTTATGPGSAGSPSPRAGSTQAGKHGKGHDH